MQVHLDLVGSIYKYDLSVAPCKHNNDWIHSRFHGECSCISQNM